MSGSSPTARWVAAATLVVAAIAAGCDGYHAEVWVLNSTDRTYALLLAVDDGPDRIRFVEIVPASECLAHQRAGRPVASFVLFNSDCRPVAGGAVAGRSCARAVWAASAMALGTPLPRGTLPAPFFAVAASKRVAAQRAAKLRAPIFRIDWS